MQVGGGITLVTVDWPAEQRLGALGTVWVARCALLLQAFHRTTGVRRACLEVLAAGSCCFAGGAALAWHGRLDELATRAGPSIFCRAL